MYNYAIDLEHMMKCLSKLTKFNTIMNMKKIIESVINKRKYYMFQLYLKYNY